jgi:hypothetical protein
MRRCRYSVRARVRGDDSVYSVKAWTQASDRSGPAREALALAAADSRPVERAGAIPKPFGTNQFEWRAPDADDVVRCRNIGFHFDIGYIGKLKCRVAGNCAKPESSPEID